MCVLYLGAKGQGYLKNLDGFGFKPNEALKGPMSRREVDITMGMLHGIYYDR